MKHETMGMAIELYGLCTVEEVKIMVERTTVDDMFNLYVDREMFLHLDCLEFLYFE